MTQFLAPAGALGIGGWSSMPGKLADRKATAFWLCRNSGQVPGEMLQVGLMMLRTIPLDQLASDESPAYWAIVGILEWIKFSSPSQADVSVILSDLWVMNPMLAPARVGLIERVTRRFPDLMLPSIRLRKHI
ncbi:MAG: hypothetical protein WBP40_01910 [Candidatus Moraniibacteriota bacterium]